MAPHSDDSAHSTQLIGRPVILELQICRLRVIALTKETSVLVVILRPEERVHSLDPKDTGLIRNDDGMSVRAEISFCVANYCRIVRRIVHLSSY